MSNKNYFKKEKDRVMESYMSANGRITEKNIDMSSYQPVSSNPPQVDINSSKNWDSSKTRSWITGLTTGFNVFNPVQQPTRNPYLGGSSPSGGTPPPMNYGYNQPKTDTNKLLLYGGIGLGLIAITILTITAIKRR